MLKNSEKIFFAKGRIPNTLVKFFAYPYPPPLQLYHLNIP